MFDPEEIAKTLTIKGPGWLSPDGEFIACKCYEHISKAEEIAKKLDLYDEDVPSDDVLIEYGWIHIAMLKITECGFNFYGLRATEPQKNALKEFCENMKTYVSESGQLELYKLGIVESWEWFNKQ